MTTTIRHADFVDSIAAALQYISYYHPADYIAHLARAYEREQSPAAKDAMAHYFSLMRMNAKAGALSRLGLARVRAEGEMDIEVDVEGERVKVVASGIVAR